MIKLSKMHVNIMNINPPKRCCQNAAFGDPLLAAIVERVRYAYGRGAVVDRAEGISEMKRELFTIIGELDDGGY